MLAYQSGDFPGKTLRNNQALIFSGPLFDLLGVFVKFLEVIKIEGINWTVFGLIDVVHCAYEAEPDLGFTVVIENGRVIEPFVFFRIKVTKHYVKRNCLHKFALFSVFEDIFDAVQHVLVSYLTHL